MKLFNFSHPLSEDAKRRLVEVVQIDYEDFNEEIFKFQLDMSDNVVGQVLNSVIENIISKVANEKYLYDKNAREEDAFLVVLPSLSIAAGIFSAILQNATDARIIPDCGFVVIKPRSNTVGVEYVVEDVFWLDEI